MEASGWIAVFQFYGDKVYGTPRHCLFHVHQNINVFLLDLGENPSHFLAVQGVMDRGKPGGRWLLGNKSKFTQLANVAAVMLE